MILYHMKHFLYVLRKCDWSSVTCLQDDVIFENVKDRIWTSPLLKFVERDSHISKKHWTNMLSCDNLLWLCLRKYEAKKIQEKTF